MNKLGTIVVAQPKHIEVLAQTMRAPDRDEVWATAHVCPDLALELSVAGSCDPMTALWDGEIICMFGCGAKTLTTNVGVPWMLGTNKLADPVIGRNFLRGSVAYIRRLKKRFSTLENYVDARHMDAVRWINWLGFEVSDPEPYGVSQLPFHRFSYERSSDVGSESRRTV